MDQLKRSSLDEADEDVLYELLGEAWNAQAVCNNPPHDPAANNYSVGRREFQAIAPLLQEALRQPFYQGVSARVASMLQVEVAWDMPSPIIIALARHRGFLGKKVRPD